MRGPPIPDFAALIRATKKEERRARSPAFSFPRALTRKDQFASLRPPVKATRGLVGESPDPGASTTTTVFTLTRLYRSIASSLVRRMQPDEIAEPIYSG